MWCGHISLDQLNIASYARNMNFIKRLIRKLFTRVQTYDSLEEFFAHNPINSDWKKNWKPGSYYSPEGQCVFFYLENVDYYGKWINHDITLYLAEDDDRIVGGMIHVFKN